MHVHTCMHMFLKCKHSHTHMCVCSWKHKCFHACTHTNTHMHTNTHRCTNACLRMQTCVHMHTFMWTHTSTHVFAHVFTWTCQNTHTHTCTCGHACAHMHAHVFEMQTLTCTCVCVFMKTQVFSCTHMGTHAHMHAMHTECVSVCTCACAHTHTQRLCDLDQVLVGTMAQLASSGFGKCIHQCRLALPTSFRAVTNIWVTGMVLFTRFRSSPATQCVVLLNKNSEGLHSEHACRLGWPWSRQSVGYKFPNLWMHRLVVTCIYMFR